MAKEKVLYRISRNLETGRIVVEIDSHYVAEIAGIAKLVQLLCPVDNEAKNHTRQGQ